MTDERVPMTRAGYNKLKAEIDQLQNEQMPEIERRIAAARAEGDLSENAEYEDAKNEQAFVEGEIARLERILSSAEIIAEVSSKDRVMVGSVVTVVEKGTKEQEVYHLVGSAEANPREGKISTESPLGKALMGAKVGEKVEVNAPDGKLTFTIKSIA